MSAWNKEHIKKKNFQDLGGDRTVLKYTYFRNVLQRNKLGQTKCEKKQDPIIGQQTV
jgi:hypothetical protein